MMSKNLVFHCELPSDISIDPQGPQGARLRAALQTASTQVMQGAWPLVRPVVGVSWQAGAQGHYHTAPEMFVQLSGWTHFTFPDGECLLQPGQVLLLPAYLQHQERVGGGGGGAPFSNLVLYAESERLSVHLAGERHTGHPEVRHLEFRHGAACSPVLQWLQQASHRAQRGGVDSDSDWVVAEERRAVALTAAALTSVWQMLMHPGTDPGGDSPLVAKVRLWVKNQLGDADLSVQGLAAQAECSADHLSQRFRKETGEYLVAYITRLRMERACHLLEHAELAVKEVAWACGYSRSSYFIQAFRRAFGVTPQAWRAGRSTMQTIA